MTATELVAEPPRTGAASGRRRRSSHFALALYLLALSVVASADLSNIEVGGVNVRLAWVLVPLIWVLSPKHRADPRLAVLCLVLFLLHAIAGFVAGSALKSLVYACWIIFNYLFFFSIAFAIACRLRQRVWTALLWSGRLQILAAMLMVAGGLQQRAQFLYFEPSYFSIALVPYVFCVVFWSRSKLLDFALLGACLLLSQSANLLLIYLFAVIYVVITGRHWRASVAIAVLLPAGVYGLYVRALESTTDSNHVLAQYISDNGISPDLLEELINRGGNRGPRITAAAEVLEEHLAFGIGPGNYVELTQAMDFDHISGGLSYFDPAGRPPVNVLLEAMTNAGVLTVVPMLLAFFIVFTDACRLEDRRERLIVIGSMLCLGFILQLESNYLRAYVWMFFGIFHARGMSVRPRRRRTFREPRIAG